jgi:hypothetical protein
MKTETMATSDIRKALLFMASTSDAVVNRRPATAKKNMGWVYYLGIYVSTN